MTAPALADTLGPRARRRVVIVSALAVAVFVLILVVALGRFADKGQLDPDKWRPLAAWGVIRFLLIGMLNTLKAALVAMAGALVIGTLLALGRLARLAPVRWLAGAYVELFRSVPLLLLILFSFFVLPKYGLDVPRLWYLVFGLVVYNSAVLGEIFRAGILSLDRGQTEAAHAIGLSYWQTMLIVVIPQAARRMIPAIVSQLVTLLKDTSLGAVIAYEELLRRAQATGDFQNNVLQALFVAALMYIAVNLMLSRLARRLEIRQRRRYRAGRIDVIGIEDLAVMEAAAEAEETRTQVRPVPVG